MRTYGKTEDDKFKPKKLSPAEIVIEAFGGSSRLANMLNISPQSVCNWRTQGKGVVPAKYRQDVAELAVQYNINIDGKIIWSKINASNS
jgi:hypothetical protein